MLNNMLKGKIPRLTDADCTQFFQQKFGARVVVHYKEYTQAVAHACSVAGPMQLAMRQITLNGRTVLYTQCPYCKKVWYFVPQVL